MQKRIYSRILVRKDVPCSLTYLTDKKHKWVESSLYRIVTMPRLQDENCLEGPSWFSNLEN